MRRVRVRAQAADAAGADAVLAVRGQEGVLHGDGGVQPARGEQLGEVAAGVAGPARRLSARLRAGRRAPRLVLSAVASRQVAVRRPARQGHQVRAQPHIPPVCASVFIVVDLISDDLRPEQPEFQWTFELAADAPA